MHGLTYRGKHSIRDMGIYTKTVTRPFLPPKRVAQDVAPLQDGSIDYTYRSGRAYYDDRVVEVQVSIINKGRVQLNRDISRVIGWLEGGFGDLIFDDMPLVTWRAMPVNLSNTSIELSRIGVAIVQFRCRPFNKLIYPSNGIPLDFDIPLGDDMPLGFGDDQVFEITSGSNHFVLSYLGDAPVRPRIILTGVMDGFSIVMNETTFFYSGNITELIIDCDRCICTVGSEDVTVNSSGDFLEILPGENEFTVTCNGAGTVEFEYNAQYLYGEGAIFDDSNI